MAGAGLTTGEGDEAASDERRTRHVPSLVAQDRRGSVDQVELGLDQLVVGLGPARLRRAHVVECRAGRAVSARREGHRRESTGIVAGQRPGPVAGWRRAPGADAHEHDGGHVGVGTGRNNRRRLRGDGRAPTGHHGRRWPVPHRSGAGSGRVRDHLPRPRHTPGAARRHQGAVPARLRACGAPRRATGGRRAGRGALRPASRPLRRRGGEPGALLAPRHRACPRAGRRARHGLRGDGMAAGSDARPPPRPARRPPPCRRGAGDRRADRRRPGRRPPRRCAASRPEARQRPRHRRRPHRAGRLRRRPAVHAGRLFDHDPGGDAGLCAARAVLDAVVLRAGHRRVCAGGHDLPPPVRAHPATAGRSAERGRGGASRAAGQAGPGGGQRGGRPWPGPRSGRPAADGRCVPRRAAGRAPG